MADRNEQMAHQGWAKGYADGYIAGLEEAWARVNARIERGPLPRTKMSAVMDWSSPVISSHVPAREITCGGKLIVRRP